ALHHGDLIEFGPLTLSFGQRAEASDAALEAAIASAPHDDRLRLVYADWLQERSDPLGARMAAASRAQPGDDDEWLDGLARELSDQQLELQWRMGMLDGAALRESFNSRAAFRMTLV